MAEVAGRAVVALRGNSDMLESGEAKWFQLSNEDGTKAQGSVRVALRVETRRVKDIERETRRLRFRVTGVYIPPNVQRLLLSSKELSDTQILRALNTSPPRNRCTFLSSSIPNP